MPDSDTPFAGGDATPSVGNGDALLGDLFTSVEDIDIDKRREALDRAARAMEAALAWLHEEIERASGASRLPSTDGNVVRNEDAMGGSASIRSPASEPPSVPDARAHHIGELLGVFDYWHQQQEQRGKVLPIRLWLAWVELGSSLGVLASLDVLGLPSELHRRGIQAMSILAQTASTFTNQQLPAGFPSINFHCDKRLQIDFCANLWNAGVFRPLQVRGGRTSEDHQRLQLLDDVAVQLLSTYTAWVSRTIRGFEIVFLSEVEEALGALVRESAMKLRVTPRLLRKFISTHISPLSTTIRAANTAVCAVVAIALCDHDPEKLLLVDSLFRPVREDAAQKMILTPLPHAHEPLAIVAAGFGMAEWDTVPERTTPSSWSRVSMQVFTIIRVALLPLLSPRIGTDESRLEKATRRALSELRALIADQGQHHGDKVDLIYRVLENGVVETIGFFHNSLANHATLMASLQSAIPSELFRPALASFLSHEGEKSAAAATNSSAELSPNAVLSLLKHLYDAVAPLLLELALFPVKSPDESHGCLVRSFTLLSRLEFVREAWRSPARNQFMSIATERVEKAIDEAPDAIFTAIFQALNGSLTDRGDLWPDSSDGKVVPSEADMARGCQVLAVGLLIQRKLRALLIQSSNPQLRDDALAVIFLGINSVYEPLDTFAHRFIGVCLSHLTQFVSMYSIAPYYVQLSLPAFPSNMTQQTIAAVCGSVFGSLFYSHSSTEDGVGSSSRLERSGAETARQMIIWTMRQFLKRSLELLLAEHLDASGTAATSANNDGLYLVGLMAEITKMSPVDVVERAAVEMEALVRDCDGYDRRHRRQVSSQVKRTILTSISQNCEAEKRAWLAAWFIELEAQYPSGQTDGESDASAASGNTKSPTTTASRL